MKKTLVRGMVQTAICMLALAGIALWGQFLIPADGQLPYDLGGRGADQFIAGETAQLILWATPAVAAFIGLVFYLVSVFEPMRENLERSQKAFGAVWAASLLLLGISQLLILAAMMQWLAFDDGMRRIALIIYAAFIICIGNYLPKTRATFMFGVRTPWTLTSDTAWEKTHRLGGRLFILLGGVGIIGALAFEPRLFSNLYVAMIIAVCVFLVAYSYCVWRAAKDRLPPADYIV